MKTSQGDVFRRRENLIRLLKENETLSVNQLATYFKVAPVTIRRDLLFLEKKKLINRFYGGAQLILDPPLKQVNTQQVQTFPVELFIEKLTPFLESGTQLFISSGIFSTEIIYALSYFDVAILTNDSAAIFIHHAQKKARIHLSGGELEKNTSALVGDFATHSFNKIEADLCIIEAAGFNTHEVTTNTLNESFVYRTMLQHTKGKKIVYTPSANLETVSSFMIDRTFLFDHLYTDAEISPAILTLYQTRQISVTPLIK